MNDDLLDQNDHPIIELKTRLIRSILLQFFLFGLGAFFFSKKKWRLIYFLIAIYTWISYVNVFVIWYPGWEKFHNHTMIGALTIFIGWFIVYFIGIIDIVISYKLKVKGIRKVR